MPDGLPLIPEINDEDVEWVRGVMRLDVLDEPRRRFLFAQNTLDVSACPGSGKTTLVVAKLAMLARKWPHRTRGICILSHTNVAREEIQRRLGNNIVGQRLLSYPHFIDTIHGFVNRFLALPWLYSNGFPSPTIDNDITTAYRCGVLGKKYWSVKTFLEQKHSGFDCLRICKRDLSFDLKGKPFPAGPATESFKLAKLAVEKTARAGYFCYDEMFVWARALLEDFPATSSWLRRRFPFIIIDEMQDTFQLQGAMLHEVFPRLSSDIIVQRVGDPNQAIFDNLDHQRDESDPFPDSACCLNIPNSHRFGPQIAMLASPFAISPVGDGGLCGIGPKALACAPTECLNAIFIFPDNNTTGVLDSYGKHVLTIFDDSTLATGAVTAVGAVHRPDLNVTPGHAHYPQSVTHYWSSYTADICLKELHPNVFIHYVRAAQVEAREGRNLSPGIERIASGLIRLADRIGDIGRFKRRSRTHRAIVESLAADATSLAAYRRIIKAFLIDWIPLTRENWCAIQDDILAVACAVCEGATTISNAASFLKWSTVDSPLTTDTAASDDTTPNVYRFVDGHRRVDIQLGSIHSVKGQTHLATMLLNTYWHDHSSKQILPWLLGDKVNENGAGVRDRKRLLQTYVAMTRPSHLICLAVPRFVMGNDQALIQRIATLIGRGWCVAEIVDGTPRWNA